MIAATPKECSMKKTILASIILSLGVAALPAQAKNSGSYISRAKAVSIAKTRVGGGKVDNVDFERSSHHGAYYEIDIENRKGEYEVRVNAGVHHYAAQRDRVGEMETAWIGFQAA